MRFDRIYTAALRKYAAAVLTPEAEQAAAGAPPPDAGMMPPAGGAPMPPDAGGGMAPPPGGGMAPQGPQGGQLPPEILQDQQFIAWLAQQGVQFDPQSGMFFGPDGQPLPAEIIMQAYDQYMQEMQGGGAMPPEAAAGAPPPADAGAMPPPAGPLPPEAGAGMAPPPPADAGAMPPEAAGGMPPEGGAPAGGDMFQDPEFMAFLQDMLGVQVDPQSGQAFDLQTGQPIPPEELEQIYQQFQQQMAQGGMPPEGGAPAGPEGGAFPPEVAEQFQSMIDASLENFTAQLDKKLETLMDKLETVKMAIEAIRDTDDQRAKQEKDHNKQLQDEIAAELTPTSEKTASVATPRPRKAAKQPKPSIPAPQNMFDLLKSGVDK